MTKDVVRMLEHFLEIKTAKPLRLEIVKHLELLEEKMNDSCN